MTTSTDKQPAWVQRMDGRFLNKLRSKIEPTIPRWWAHPLRPCKDDMRYTELKGVTRAERRDMIQACASCPVYYDCLQDLLSVPLYEHYGIRAGIQGAS